MKNKIKYLIIGLIMCMLSCKHHDNHSYSVYVKEIDIYNKNGEKILEKKLKIPSVATMYIKIVNDSLITSVGAFAPIDGDSILRETINIPFIVKQKGHFLRNFPINKFLVSGFALNDSRVMFRVVTNYDIFNRAYKYSIAFTDYDSTQTIIFSDIMLEEHESYDEFLNIIKFNKKSNKKNK